MMECPKCSKDLWSSVKFAEKTGLISLCMVCGHILRGIDADCLVLEQRDALFELVLRASTDAFGCFYCDHENHTDDCPAKRAIEAVEGKA